MEKEQFKINLYFEEKGEEIEKVISNYLINEIKNKKYIGKIQFKTR